MHKVIKILKFKLIDKEVSKLINKNRRKTFKKLCPNFKKFSKHDKLFN